MIPQAEFNADSLAGILLGLIKSPERLLQMAKSAQETGKRDATEKVAAACTRYLNG
jgi:UDP-N-acetylglucosamine:LPS N-acetylglucosamine transferase